jgi:Tfp pilus assembly protein PilF
VSYAFLIAAVAREYGFDARFQLVDREPRWERFGDVVITARHLDVLVTLSDGSYVVDPEPNVAMSNQQAMRVITDETAFSQFYCNAGVEHLVRGRTLEAQRYLALATRIAPGNAAAWANLGTLDARLGRLAAAKADFERSLQLDRRGETAIDGYVTVLRRLGTADDLRRADKLERRAQAIRARNPYYQQASARLAE